MLHSELCRMHKSAAASNANALAHSGQIYCNSMLCLHCHYMALEKYEEGYISFSHVFSNSWTLKVSAKDWSN